MLSLVKRKAAFTKLQYGRKFNHKFNYITSQLFQIEKTQITMDRTRRSYPTARNINIKFIKS